VLRSGNAHGQGQFFKSLTELSLICHPPASDLSPLSLSVTAITRKCHEDTKHESVLILPLNTKSILSGRRQRKTHVTPIIRYPEFK